MKRAQTNIVVFVFILLIVVGVIAFLLSAARTLNPVEYLNLYAHNSLLSVLREDTGYTDSNCKLVSDVISCSFFTPTWQCDGSGPTCRSLAEEKITEAMDQFEIIKKSYRYLFRVEPEGFVVKDAAGTPFSINIGDGTLATEKGEKITANERISRVSQSGQFLLKVQLILKKK
ncbi:MAG: hypothetical protein KKA90_05105 [Nanoarchaeota archaeon]|nr:hypothetical protein [Nanoarchaeota archaeon]